MSLFAELKRRNVFRVAIAYVAVSWLLIQVAETVFPVYGLSDAAIRFVITAVAIGFIPVLVVSWVFELTPSGLKRDAEVDHSGAAALAGGKKFDRVILVVLALALGYFAFDKFVLDPARDAEMAEEVAEQVRSEVLVDSYGENSIAVLPFVNMSSDPEQAYFSDGIAEELLNLLARIPQLRVTSRSSSFMFRGDALNLPEVAEKLNVAHILEGSVRKAGNQVRITVQLIEARTDTHLWSETYDRSLDDIFAIQDEVAAQVVTELRLTLLGEAPKAEPVDLEAYARLLEARQIVSLQKKDEFSKAERLLKEALEIDPNYVDALVTLTSVYWVQRQAAWPHRQEELTESLRITRERAFDLDPDNAGVKAGMAWDTHHRDLDVVQAARLYEDALQADPTDPVALRGASVLASAIGRNDLATLMHEYLVETDPMTLWNYGNLGWAYLEAERYDDALRQFTMYATLSDREGGGKSHIGMAKLLSGDSAGALTEFEQIPDEYLRLMETLLALYDLGREEESAAALQRLHEMTNEFVETYDAEFDDSEEADAEWLDGFARAYARTGNPDQAFQYLRRWAGVDPGSLGNLASDPLLRRLHDDPRWLPLLEDFGRTPEQLARIEFNPRLPAELRRGN